MTWIALVLTLLLEQLRAMPGHNPVYAAVESTVDAAERGLNAGSARHGAYAWLAVVGGAALIGFGLYALAYAVNWSVALALNIIVLYFTLGFRQFSHHFTEIQTALAQGDVVAARSSLTAWKRAYDPSFNAADLSPDEVVRQAIEHGVLLSQRHVFGVLFWFLLLPGPTGPLVYRLADYTARHWNRKRADGLPVDRFGVFAQRMFAWIDWLPARLTAFGFGIVGDFESTMYCWRRASVTASNDPSPYVPAGPDSRLLLLATASGALGIRVMPAVEARRVLDEPGQEGGGLREPGADALRSVVGLAWRSLLLWMALLLLLSIAAWVT